MGRRCKCQVTGEYGTTDTFVKVDGKYYKSQEVYEKKKRELDARKNVIDKFYFDFLGYESGQVFPTILTRKLKELEFYGYEVIYETIKQKEENIIYALHIKDFKNDSGKISYIMAIIKNSINDVFKDMERERKNAEREVAAEPVFDINLDHIQTKHKEKNISEWLEDDD